MSESPEPQAALEEPAQPQREESAPSEETGDLATEAAQSQEGDSQERSEQPQPEKSRYGGVQRRISELTRALRERERELADIQAREQAAKEAEALKPPKEDDFDSHEEWLEAKVAWTVERRLVEAERVREARESQRRRQEAADKLESDWAGRLERAREKFSDFEDVAMADDHVVSNAMARAIKKAELGPEIAYYLGKNPSESNAIARLGDDEAEFLAIGRLEAKLRSQQNAERRRSNAPPPPAPARSAATTTPNALSDKAPVGDWMKARRKQLEAQRSR